MIAHLKGILAATTADHAVIEVGGVGYLVGASARTLDTLGAVGEGVMLHTEMLVGEDFLRLVGFATANERDWFRLLTGVQGVGARVALAILSALAPDELSRAVAAQDKAMVARANGVGPKLAERIVRELKDKVGAVAIGLSGSVVAPAGSAAGDALSALAPDELSRAVAAQDKAMVARANGVGPKLAERIVRELKDKVGAVAIGIVGGVVAPAGSAAGDALSALGNLGFRPAEAASAVAAAEEELGPGATLDALVRLALRKAAK